MAEEIPIDLRLRVKETFSLLEQQLQELCDRLVDSGQAHIAFALPTRQIEEEASSQIHFVTLRGEDAWDAGLAGFMQLFREEHQHQRVTYRLPGVLFVDNYDEIVGLVKQVNETKDLLKEMVLKVPSAQRHVFALRTLPGVVMLQAYRHIHASDADVRRVVFTWVRTDATERLDKAKVVDGLAREARSAVELSWSPEGLGMDEWLALIEELKEQVRAMPDSTVFRRIRPVAPHPRVVLFGQEVGKPLATYHANLPLLLPAREVLPAIRQLPVFDKAKVAGERKDRRQRQLLSPHFYFYYDL